MHKNAFLSEKSKLIIINPKVINNAIFEKMYRTERGRDGSFQIYPFRPFQIFLRSFY